MRAINLVPAEERRGGGAAGGRSGGAAYVLLGLLAVLVVVVSFYTLEKRSVGEKRSELASLEARAVGAEAQAAELASFVQFAGVRAKRVQTVTSLAASRFDWSHALRELARVVPRNVSLTGLQGTVAPGVAVKASAAGQTSGLRSALAVPAVEIVGCTTSQTSVARMITRMRLIDGVTRVALQSSVKAEASGGGGGGGGGAGGDCRQGNARFPQFALVIYFDAAAGGVPTAAKGAGRIVAAQRTPTATTGPTGPAATTGGTP
ncbi:MAG: PilN domain-containing protein [Solirubrobacteraceae bacterium]